MKAPLLHLFRLQLAPTQRDGETIRVATHADVQWNTPIFRAPSLPTPQQLGSEQRFSINFRPRLRAKS